MQILLLFYIQGLQEQKLTSKHAQGYSYMKRMAAVEDAGTSHWVQPEVELTLASPPQSSSDCLIFSLALQIHRSLTKDRKKALENVAKQKMISF